MNTDGSILVTVERENVNDDSVIVLSVFAADGDAVSHDDVVLEIETSKTNLEIVSPADGYLQLHVAVDEEVDIGAPLFSIHEEKMLDLGAKQTTPTSIRPGDPESDSDRDPTAAVTGNVLFSKAAEQRRMELNVPMAHFAGRGWITVSDVDLVAGLRPQASPASAPESTDQSAVPTSRHSIVTTPYNEKRKTKRKQAETGNLTYHGNELPQSTIWTDIPISGSRVVEPPFLFEDSIADVVVYESSKLFSNYPTLNAFHIDSRHYGQYDALNFGISFDSGENLKVLSVDNSDRLSLTEVQSNIEALLHLYESGDSIEQKLLTSSTVTLSDLTQTSASSILPLLNGAQSLILGLSKREQHIYSIAASFDHRVAEGLIVSRFLGELAERIQSYFKATPDPHELICFSCARTMSEELALGNRAMIAVRTRDGKDALMCRNCFEGW